ncbi:MAG TPA: Rrf2 family transcriptional regulator [Bacteroidales bacterium]|jgi:Rrf2 family protein|nr:Rrf2 family transcriptional regulator [Bacteroidales bacterium]
MFNKETEYAIRSLVYIKLQNIKSRRPGVAEISKEIEAPPFFVAKILQRLVRDGYLRSLKGKGGGFYFDENKKDLALLDLITETEGNDSFTSCVFGLKECNSDEPCPLHEKYAPIRDSLTRLVSDETVGGLAEKMYEKELSGKTKS